MKRPTIKEAAKTLGISSARAFAILREHNVIGSQNLARVEFQKRGFFIVEQRGFHMSGRRTANHYAVTTVTPMGMAFIQDLLDGVAPERPLVDGKHNEAPDQRSESEEPLAIHRVGTAVTH